MQTHDYAGGLRPSARRAMSATLTDGGRTRALFTSGRADAVAALGYREVGAAIIGAGAAAVGFSPVTHPITFLDVMAHPERVLVTPGVLLVVLAAAFVWILRPRQASRSPRLPLSLSIALAAIAVGLVLSLFESRSPGQSLALGFNALIVPTVLYFVLRRGVLPPRILAASWLWAISLFLIRADIVFLRLHGLPTTSALFAAKFANARFDFHYYTLGNPDHTGTYLLLPFGLSLFWAIGSESRRAKIALSLVAALMLFSIYLTYARSALAFAGVLLIIACVMLPYRRRVRFGLVAGLILVAAVAVITAGHRNYLTDIFSTSHASSADVRVSSIVAGWHAFVHHPVTGVGFGQFGSDAVTKGVSACGVTTQAHSAVIQGAAELGVMGLIGFGLATVALLVAAGRAIMRRTPGLADGALIGLAAYVFLNALSGAINEGVMVDYVSVYAIGIALAAALAQSPSTRSSGGGEKPSGTGEKPSGTGERPSGGERPSHRLTGRSQWAIPAAATLLAALALGATTHSASARIETATAAAGSAAASAPSSGAGSTSSPSSSCAHRSPAKA
jgi:O-Antigen ligase